MRVGLAEDRDQHVAPVDLVLAGRLHVRGGALEDALEAERLLRRAVVLLGQRLQVGLEVRLGVLDEPGHVAAARPDDLRHATRRAGAPTGRARGQELVPAAARLAHGQAEASLERSRQPHAQASSMLQRSGNSCSRASASTCATRVSATSRE